MEELWKPVIGYETLYEVSSLGRVRSLPKRGFQRVSIIKTTMDLLNGYVTIQLWRSNKPLTKRVHRLVAEAFLEKPSYPVVVNHKDGIKKNNRLDNLEWITYAENTLHAYKKGLAVAAKGEQAGQTKLKESEVRQIFKYFEEGLSNIEIAEKYKIRDSQVSRIRSGKRWSHLGLSTTVRWKTYKTLSSSVIEELKKRLADGQSKLRIEREIGISRKSTIYKTFDDDIC